MADFSEYGIPAPDWAPLEATLPSFPPDITPEQLRAVANQTREDRSAKSMSAGLGSIIQTKDYTVPTRDGESVGVRTYRPNGIPQTQPLPVYIHLHGGGFLMGNLNTEDALCALIIKRNLDKNHPIVVVNVNYRHTPEYKYPTAWDDSEDAFVWVHDHITEIGGLADQVVVGGISAGGQLTASLALTQLRGDNKRVSSLPKIRGQVLLIPCLVHSDYYAPRLELLCSPEVSSKVQCANAPILPITRLNLFMSLLGVEGLKGAENDRRISPGNATPEEVKNLPPAVFGIAGNDPLRDEGLFYSKLLSENGVPTDTYVFPGVPHGFRSVGDLVSNEAWDRVMSDGIAWALSNPPAVPFKIQVN